MSIRIGDALFMADTHDRADLLLRIKILETENGELRRQLRDYKKQEEELLSKDPDNSDYNFYDLFDTEEIQAVQDAFASASGVASLITLPDGTPVTKPSNFCRLCRDIIRKTDKGLSNCMHSDCILGAYNPDGPTIKRCLSGGLWDAGASINAGEKHICNWLIGQVRSPELDEQEMNSYAGEIGVDVNVYREALKEVPVMSLKQFTRIANALHLFANLLSRIALQNLRQKRSLSRLGGLLPICSSCKKIRDDQGYWNQIETYIATHSQAMFSHSLCPDCMEKLYGKQGWYRKNEKKKDILSD